VFQQAIACSSASARFHGLDRLPAVGAGPSEEGRAEFTGQEAAGHVPPEANFKEEGASRPEASGTGAAPLRCDRVARCAPCKVLTSSAVRILVQQIDAEQAKLEAAANQMVVEKTPKKIKVPASAPRHPGTHSALRYKQHATYSTAYFDRARRSM
jgi:hypothetical protein